MRNKIFFLLTVVAVAAATLITRAADTTRVLFIGNSFTAYNDLPETFRLLAASTPSADVVVKGSNTPGGYLLMNHSTNAQTLALIDAGGWDFVVLQEQSQVPAFPDAQFQQDVVPYARTLSQRIRQHNPCARIVFYNTWGYKTGDAQNCAFFTPLCTYTGMDSMLRLRYRLLSDSNDAIQGPAGPVWRRIRATAPGIELYDADERHPSSAGTYAAACALYAVIFGKNPQTATYNASLSTADAATIRSAAKVVAFDSLAYWRAFAPALPVPTAAFTRAVNGATVAFNSTSTGAAQYRWSFGTGAVSTLQNPVYTYPVPGTYMVKLVVKTACGVADSTVQNVTVSASGVAAPLYAAAVLHPNPAGEKAWITNLPTGTDVTVSDAGGRELWRAEAIRGEVVLPLSLLAPGHYRVRAAAQDVQRVWQLVRL